MRILLFLLSCMVSLSPLSAGGAKEPIDAKPVVAVTIVPEQTFVRKVAGEVCDVVVMVPPGSSPETYEPTPRQKVELEKASVYFAIGVPSEMAILPSVRKETTLVHLEDIVRESYPDLLLGTERDPHIWLSVKRVIVMIDAIVEQLSLSFPAYKEQFAENGAQYKAELLDADGEIRSSLSAVKTKEFVVYHPAFGYFADEYGLTQFALEEEGKEATPRHIAEMVDLARSRGLKVIFYQAETDSRQSMAFAEDEGGVAVKLEPLSADYTENLKKMAAAFREAR